MTQEAAWSMTTVSAVSYPYLLQGLETRVFVYMAVHGLSVFAGVLSTMSQLLCE